MASSNMESMDEIPVVASNAVFFDNEKNIGFDPVTNDPIFTGSRKMARFRPKIDKETGEQSYLKHAITGMPLVAENELDEIFDEVHIYKKVVAKSGVVYREECEHPEVLWQRFREASEREAAEARGRALLMELGAAGLSAADIQRGIAAAKGAAPVVQQNVTKTETFPAVFAPGLWYLSEQHRERVEQGTEKPFAGTKSQAEDAALILWDQEQRAASESIPSF